MFAVHFGMQLAAQCWTSVNRFAFEMIGVSFHSICQTMLRSSPRFFYRPSSSDAAEGAKDALRPLSHSPHKPRIIL